MAKITLEEQQEFQVLPVDSIVLARIDTIEEQEVEGRNGRPNWKKLNFTFKILAIQHVGDGSSPAEFDELVGRNLYGNVSARFTTSPENTLRQWVEAIYGMELQPGFELDTDLLLNKQVRVVTSTYNTAKGYLRHQAESLLPYAQSGVGAAPVGQAPQQAYGQPQVQQYAQPPVTSFTQPQVVADPWASQGGYTDEPPF